MAKLLKIEFPDGPPHTGLEIDWHSRGAMTICNALQVIANQTGAVGTKKWFRLFEQHFPIYKWSQGKLQTMQSRLIGRSTLEASQLLF